MTVRLTPSVVAQRGLGRQGRCPRVAAADDVFAQQVERVAVHVLDGHGFYRRGGANGMTII
jgi:hypothetical protein